VGLGGMFVIARVSDTTCALATRSGHTVF